MPTPVPPIPYGWSDFALMRRERSLYVDKTRFLRDAYRDVDLFSVDALGWSPAESVART